MEAIKGKCCICGENIEGGKHADETDEICYSCWLCGLVPKGYEHREDYEYCTIDGTNKARRKPLTGVGILDCPGAVSVADIVSLCPPSVIEHRYEAESREGLTHDF